MESNPAAQGVRQLEVGEALADLGAGGVSIGFAGAAGVAEGRRGIEAELVAFDRHVEKTIGMLCV